MIAYIKVMHAWYDLMLWTVPTIDWVVGFTSMAVLGVAMAWYMNKK